VLIQAQAEKNRIGGVQGHVSAPDWLAGEGGSVGVVEDAAGVVVVGKQRADLEELSTWQLLAKARPMALDLSWCSLGTAGLALASRHLRTVPSLSVLYIGGNIRPGKETSSSLARLSTDLAALLAINTPLRLRELRLDTATGASKSTGTADVADQYCLKHSLVPLLASLATNKSLTGLFISGNQCGDKGADALGMALAANSTLLRLDFDGNRTTEKGYRKVLDGLRENKTLRVMPTPSQDVMRIMKKGGQPKREIDEIMMQIESCIHTNRSRNAPVAEGAPVKQPLQQSGGNKLIKGGGKGGAGNAGNAGGGGGSGSSALNNWRRKSVMLDLQMQVEQGSNSTSSRNSVALAGLSGMSPGMDATEEEIDDELEALMRKARGETGEARVLGSPSPKASSAVPSYTNGGRGSFVARDMPDAFAAVSHPAQAHDSTIPEEAIHETGGFGFDDIGKPEEQVHQSVNFAMANPLSTPAAVHLNKHLSDPAAEAAAAREEEALLKAAEQEAAKLAKEAAAAAKVLAAEQAAAAKAAKKEGAAAEKAAKKAAKEEQARKEKESLEQYKREKERLAEEARARAESYEQGKESRFGYWNEKADEHQVS
jgi:hypothetical protein